MSPAAAIAPEHYTAFGALLKFLRQRAGLTQRELSIAVGYTESHISRLEHDQRAPDAAVLAARFVPALGLEAEPQWVARLLALAGGAPALPAAAAPPLAPPSSLPGYLPAPLTSFVGRERELAEIERLLADTTSRLLTLTGAGGSGKTRLALRAAAQRLPAFPDGAWFIDLAPLSESQHLGPTLLTALGLLDDPHRPPLAVAADFLKNRTALLILDNCEHLVAVCAQAAQTLLQGCPGLRILATSREVLGASGELVYHVPTLPAPDPARLPALEDLAQFEAVRLFTERARAAFAGFALTLENAAAVAQVCWQLDGIPLALELAAARVQTLRVEQIAARLAAHGRFRLLTGGSRTAQPRQQTLQAMIEWSCALLSAPEAVLFRRLAVFAGGWTLEAAEAVAGDGNERSEGGSQKSESVRLPTSDVLDQLAQLVNKSLVIAERQPGAETRYRMLETIRQFAHERLWAAGEGAAAQQKHLDYFVSLAERAAPELRGPDQLAWLDRVEAEHSNWRAALEQSVEDNVLAGLRLASALYWFWWIREHKREGGDWLERLLALEAAQRGEQPLSTEHALVRGKALNVAATLLEVVRHRQIPKAIVAESLTLHRNLGLPGRQGLAQALINATTGDISSLAMLEESRRLFEEVDDRFGLGECLSLLSELTWLLRGDFELARQLGEEHVALRQTLGDWDGLAGAQVRLGYMAFSTYDYDSAAQRLSQAVEIFRRLRNKWGITWALANLGDALCGLGDYGPAQQCYEEAFQRVRELGDRYRMGNITFGLGNLALSQGHYQQASHHYAVAIAEAREAGAKWLLLLGLYFLGEVLWSEGHYETAAQCYAEALTVAQEAEEIPELKQAYLLYGLGKVEHAQGAFSSARTRHNEALAIWRGSGELRGLNDGLEALAIVLTDQLQGEPAARLFGATHTSHAARRFIISPAQRSLRERTLNDARAQLGEAAFGAAFAAGQAMTVNEAVEYALGLGVN